MYKCYWESYRPDYSLLGRCQCLEAMLVFSILDLHCSCTELPCCTHISSNIVCRQSWLFCVKRHVVPGSLVSSFLILIPFVYFCLLCALWGHRNCLGLSVYSLEEGLSAFTVKQDVCWLWEIHFIKFRKSPLAQTC